MDWTLEVVIVPVRDLDRSIAFYRDQVGFDLDHLTEAGDVRFAQLTPPGSGCSIVMGNLPGMDRMAPGTQHGLQLVVPDATAARQHLLDAGIEAGEIVVVDDRDGGTFFSFSDPDGNSWGVQQIRARGERPLIPVDYRRPFGADQQG
jgi:catechol 2,3-dioxygenase-like lactoylglutathione lyase family enzyme